MLCMDHPLLYPLNMIDPKALKHLRRIQASDESKRTVMQKYRAIKKLQEIAEDKIIEGDDWRSTYRLPELFGICERKKSDVLENPPEMKISTHFLDPYNMAVPAQATMDYFDEQSNHKDTTVEVKSMAIDYGTGIELMGIANIRRKMTMNTKADLFLKKNPKESQVYYGAKSTTIDIRDAFPHPAATVDHDPSGSKGMDWFYHRLGIYTLDQFKQDFGNNPIFDISKVKPCSWTDIEKWASRELTKHEQEEKHGAADTASDRDKKAQQNYVVVFEGWDSINDDHVYIANDALIYEGAMPLMHKQIPVAFHYNYKRDDSIWGISEAEIVAPFVLIKEVLINLMIDNAKLSQQPVIAISGDVNFDPDENVLEPGALFTLGGLNGGKIGDSIAPLTFGSSVEPANAVKNILEDLQIQVTGDDSRALFVSPGELATQTLAKRESMKKRVRKNAMQNAIRAARTSAYQRFSNYCQFLAKPYQDMYGNWRHHTIYMDGFKVTQRTKEDLPEFTPIGGHQGSFELNDKILAPDKIRFTFKERVDDSVKKEVEMQGLQWWMQTIFSLAQVQPQIMENVDLELLAQQTGSYFSGLDTAAIFNPAVRAAEGSDEMTFYINQVQLGIKPVIPTDGNNFKRLSRFIRFTKSKEFKELEKEQQGLLAGAIADIAGKIYEENSGSYADSVKRRRLGVSGDDGEQEAVPGAAQADGTQAQPVAQPTGQPTAGA